MTPLLVLLPCPLLIVLVTAVIRRPATTTRIAAVLMWAQLAIALIFWGPIALANAPSVLLRAGFSFDSTAALFIILTTVVGAAALTHAVAFFDQEIAVSSSSVKQIARQIRQVYIFAPLFLLAMYCVVSADNLGYLWIGMEATTLLSAPLVYYYRSSTSLEATWKYLIVCSVGIAFAFFGTAILYAASQHVNALAGGTLSLAALASHANLLPIGLLRLGFLFILLGYGTKAGLFPLHNWLPDAHSEAPAPVSAILSGALLNCALVALWRTSGLMQMAGQGLLVRQTLLPMGALTVIAAALFLLRQYDIKRLLAYSSMENVGVMAVAVALGSSSGFALQAINHSLVKVALFLIAGNLMQQFGTKKIKELHGLLTTQPVQGILLFFMVVAVAGTPPFGSFLAEWQILTFAADHHNIGALITLLIGLALAFVALSIQICAMLFGTRSDTDLVKLRFGISSLSLVPTILLAASLFLGIALTPHLLALAGRLAR